MKSWLLTFYSRNQFLQSVQILSRQEHWTLIPITSFDCEKVDGILHLPKRSFSFSVVAFFMAMFGIALGFSMQWYSATIDTPLNIGGRPLNSWPAFIPVTFILMVLCAALGVFGFFFFRLKLPWPSHPLFFAKSYNLSKKHYQILLQSKSLNQNHDSSVALATLSALLNSVYEVEELP
jgi:hypothetical protein